MNCTIHSTPVRRTSGLSDLFKNRGYFEVERSTDEVRVSKSSENNHEDLSCNRSKKVRFDPNISQVTMPEE